MSISSEITRISGNVSDAFDAIEAKGVTVPSGSTSDDLSTLIAQIPTGSGGAITISDAQDSGGGVVRTITAITVSGTKSITANGTGIDVTEYAAVDVAVPSASPNLQAKTNISPTESSQTIEADTGYDGLSSVQINAMPSGTEGAPTATKGTVSSNSVTVTPSVTNTAGYISGGTHTGTAVTVSASELVSGTKNITTSGTTDVTNYTSASVAAGSVTAPSTISGTSATVSTGTNTLTLTKTVSVTPSVTTAGYISSGTAGDSSVSLTASVTTQTAQTIHPSTSDQSIAASRYLTGAQTIKAVTMANLTADNIKSGITVKIGDSTDDDCVASVTGTYSGGSSKAVYTYSGLVSRTANSYGATNAKVTVTKAGTYNISFVAVRGSSSGTMGTNLHIGSTEKGNNTTWNNGTYGQSVSYTSQSISANTDVTIYATSGSNSRAIHVGQLIVEEV